MDAQSQNSDDSFADKLLSSYDYELPPEQIAQTPLSPRDSSRLLVVASTTHHTHQIFRDLPQLLQPGDLLVLNDTRVIPARLYGHKSTGAPVEVLLLEEQEDNCWLALVKPGKRLKPGAEIWFEACSQPEANLTPNSYSPNKDTGKEWGNESQMLQTRGRGDGENGNPAQNFAHPKDTYPQKERDRGKSPIPNLKAIVLARDEATSGRLLQFELPVGLSLKTFLGQYGQIPLPPYITNTQATPEQYQTVYAQSPGAIAAPTAGLHFTDELLEQCRARGIGQAHITLHVGVGTFRPVEVDNVTEHQMHGEWLEVPQLTVDKIRETKQAGGRIIAVGTTVVRALEGAVVDGELQPYCGKTELFIYPGYQWQVVEGLITNFHLPRSSLLMLVSAMLGRQRLLNLYQEAIAHQYRFYSFGDAMLILPEA
ncbi:MAG: tRNA preQ1(34) S-adenosylmethionine ribosyltransferase-isomerase QueA [Symploca sp. SIO3E6]|nr:tRNA preQ1(34) S-adenosylmethionine ribosyltransferase-isomerase QueA [Caldora sp. SIO3E6]